MPDNLTREIIDRAQQLGNRIDPGFRARTMNAISRALEFWGLRLPWPGLRETEDFLADGSKFIVFPYRVGTIISITDKTNNRALDPGDNWNRRITHDYSQDPGGAAYEWRDMGFQAISSQPATDTQLRLLASVSEALEVRVQGLVRDAGASGTAMELQSFFETITMGGTEPTLTSNTYAQIDFVEKEIATSGTLKVVNPLTGVVISYIPAHAGRAQFRRAELRRLPPAGTVMRVEYYRRPDTITSEDQPIDISVDISYLEWRAAGDLLWIGKQQGAAREAWGKADEIIGAKISAEKMRGESTKSTSPLFTYMSLEEP